MLRRTNEDQIRHRVLYILSEVEQQIDYLHRNEIVQELSKVIATTQMNEVTVLATSLKGTYN